MKRAIPCYIHGEAGPWVCSEIKLYAHILRHLKIVPWCGHWRHILNVILVGDPSLEILLVSKLQIVTKTEIKYIPAPYSRLIISPVLELHKCSCPWLPWTRGRIFGIGEWKQKILVPFPSSEIQYQYHKPQTNSEQKIK